MAVVPPSPPDAMGPASGALSVLGGAASAGVPVGGALSTVGIDMPVSTGDGAGIVVMASVIEPPGLPPVPGEETPPAEQAARHRRDDRLN